jgi:hypothetical protein
MENMNMIYFGKIKKIKKNIMTDLILKKIQKLISNQNEE